MDNDEKIHRVTQDAPPLISAVHKTWCVTALTLLLFLFLPNEISAISHAVRDLIQVSGHGSLIWLFFASHSLWLGALVFFTISCFDHLFDRKFLKIFNPLQRFRYSKSRSK